MDIMRRNRSRSQYSPNEGGSLLGSIVRTVLIVAILGAAGGVTWVALTPLDAPTHEVVRPLPEGKLGAG